MPAILSERISPPRTACWSSGSHGKRGCMFWMANTSHPSCQSLALPPSGRIPASTLVAGTLGARPFLNFPSYLSVAAWFFLGAGLLMTDDPEAAHNALEQVIALGDTPYRLEGHYYNAKALLRLGDADAASAQLDLVRNEPGEIGDQARALADSVREWAQR